LIAEPFVFGSASSYQKLSPALFDAWAALLRRTPNAVLRLLRYDLHAVAEPKLKYELAARGVHPARLEFLDLQPWVDHHWHKGRWDLALDTVAGARAEVSRRAPPAARPRRAPRGTRPVRA
jgi:predicted O-linked N-acetylglucosamine transferase (SPINDLY family)